jgi:hypothetical protein
MFKTICISIMTRVGCYPAIWTFLKLSELKIKSIPFFWPRLSIFGIIFHINYHIILTSCRWNCKPRSGCFKAHRASCKGVRWETSSFLLGKSSPQVWNLVTMYKDINMIGLSFIKRCTILFVKGISKMSTFGWPWLFVLVDDFLMTIDRAPRI